MDGQHEEVAVGRIGEERREVEFEPLPVDPVPEPREEPAPTEPAKVPAPA